MTRAYFVWLHRWIGLTIVGFLLVVGLTGSLIAFYDELNRLLAPEIYAARSGGAELFRTTRASIGPIAVISDKTVIFSVSQIDTWRRGQRNPRVCPTPIHWR